MNNIRFIMLVGLPGSGKSTWAKNYAAEHNEFKIISSDKIREELYPNLDYCNIDNNKVFKLTDEKVMQELKVGNSVIYDATNLSKLRRNILMEIRSKFPDVTITIRFFNEEIETCLKRDSEREACVGVNSILRLAKSYTSFYIEVLDKLVDTIEINKCNEMNHYYYSLLVKAKNTNQKNPYHLKNLYKHIISVKKKLLSNSLIYSTTLWTIYGDVAMFHDLGKLFSGTHFNSLGKYDKFLHYYNHENISSYLYDVCVLSKQAKIFYTDIRADIYKFYPQALIERHMAENVNNKRNIALDKKFYILNTKLHFIQDLNLFKSADKHRNLFEKIIIKLRT